MNASFYNVPLTTLAVLIVKFPLSLCPQYAEALAASFAWEYMKKNVPHFIGDVNPNNDQIREIFGDQGGY